MKLITISGLDGSGKTTQLDKLELHLQEKDGRVYRFHIIEFSIANKLLCFKNKKTNSAPAKAITNANNFSIMLRKIALIVDVFRFNVLFNKIKNNKTYDYILIDRYFYDQIINIFYLEQKSNPRGEEFPKPFWQKIVEGLIIKPDIAIFIQVSPETAISRDREIEQGKQFLIDKQKIFNLLANQWNIEIINGEDTIENIFKKITKIAT